MASSLPYAITSTAEKTISFCTFTQLYHLSTDQQTGSNSADNYTVLNYEEKSHQCEDEEYI